MMKTIAKTYSVPLRKRMSTTISGPVREKRLTLEVEALTVRRAGVLLIFVPKEPCVPVYRIRFTEEMARDGLSLAALLEG